MKRWNLRKHLIACISLFIGPFIIGYLSDLVGLIRLQELKTSSIGIIGGADGPTTIWVTSGPFNWFRPILAWAFFCLMLILLYWPLIKWIRKNKNQT